MIEVYYAEDDETIGKSVKEYLEQQNCKVSVFDRIADAKKALIGHLPTIVLLDWNMPDGQGNELCLWIRERWKTLPIIYLSNEVLLPKFCLLLSKSCNPYSTSVLPYYNSYSRIKQVKQYKSS